MLKFTFLIRKKEEMSLEEFVNHHKNKHAPLFMSIKETEQYVKKYVVSHPKKIDGFPNPEYDGITDIYFENMDDFNAFYASENYKQKVHPDEHTFIDLNSVVPLASKETVIKE